MKNNKFVYYLLTFIYVIAHIIVISTINIFWSKQYIEIFLIVKEKGLLGVILLSIIAIIVYVIIILFFSYLSAKFSNLIDKFK